MINTVMIQKILIFIRTIYNYLIIKAGHGGFEPQYLNCDRVSCFHYTTHPKIPTCQRTLQLQKIKKPDHF